MIGYKMICIDFCREFWIFVYCDDNRLQYLLKYTEYSDWSTDDYLEYLISNNQTKNFNCQEYVIKYICNTTKIRFRFLTDQ